MSMFAFGLGLSYTSLKMADLNVSGENATVKVRNAGKRAGLLWLNCNCGSGVSDFSGGIPERRLMGFQRLELALAESAENLRPVANIKLPEIQWKK